MAKVTINIVAQHAGVSKKTVSRVLNDEPNVSEQTKLKVQEVFKKLGYRPSPVARGLATNQSFLIGLVYDNPNKSYVSDVQNGALSRCQKYGYHLVIQPADHESEHLLTQIEALWVESRLDGLVLTPPFSDMEPLLAMLDNLGAKYVRIGSTRLNRQKSFNENSELVQTKSVISNDQAATREMTNYLISLGHNDIAFIKGHPDHPVSEQRYQGYLEALEENRIALNPERVTEGKFDFQSGEIAARYLLNGESRPTAILASNDYMAAGVLKVASQKKISVPHSLSVVGFDNAPISEYIWPSLTTVKQPIYDMAARAIALLIGKEVSEEPTESPICLASQLVIRESTAPPINN